MSVLVDINDFLCEQICYLLYNVFSIIFRTTLQKIKSYKFGHFITVGCRKGGIKF